MNILEYYYLVFSPDEASRSRRLGKALRENCPKILLNSEWILHSHELEALIAAFPNSTLWALKISHQNLLNLTNQVVENCLQTFNEIHLEFDPSERQLSGHLERLKQERERIFPTVVFDSYFDVSPLIDSLPLWVREQLYFSPCAKKMAAKDVFKLGEILRKKHPGIPFRVIPGTDQYDSRIPESVELSLQAQEQISLCMANPDIQVSFIIPTHNNLPYLKNCLRHLLRQKTDRRHFEIIVVDDGSTDQDLASLRAFLSAEMNSLNLRYFFAPKNQSGKNQLGQFRAGLCRNLGAREAQGTVLSFLDSDMLVPDHYIQLVQEGLTKSDILQFVRKHIFPKNSDQFTNYTEVSEKQVFIEEATYWAPFFNCEKWMSVQDYWKYTCTYGLSVRKEDFLRIGRFRKTFVSYGFEDTDFGYRAHKLGLRFHLEKTPLLHLTDYADKARYHHSLMHKHRLLRITAKTFYLNHLDPAIYLKMRSLLD